VAPAEAGVAAVVEEEEAVEDGADEQVSGVGFPVSGVGCQVGYESRRDVAGELLTEDSMASLANRTTKRSMNSILQSLVAALALMFALYGICAAAVAQQKSFSSAEEAVKVAVAAARSNDDKELLAIFGAQAKEVLFSGDPTADKQRRAQFLAAYDEKNQLATEGENRILIVGKQDWPFPIPLVKRSEAWVFDTDKGKEEILNRRIGANELFTIQALLAVVDAQREYATKDPNRDGLPEYAQKFISDPGKKNGLYWDAKQGEPPSPLGPIMARARSEGYQGKTSTTPVPYHGYYYRLLTAQGKNAPGGAYGYLWRGKLVFGFAVVAYPAQYGNSGVMTFIVNHDGKVFQKNLGSNTASVAKSMKEYNPDSTWTEVKEEVVSKQ
jgi:hypothetical protein